MLSAESVQHTQSPTFVFAQGLWSAESNNPGTVLDTYNLALLDQNGQAIEFEGSVTVRIPNQSNVSGDLRIFWFDPDTGAVADMNARREGNYLVFETTHFSYYALVQMSTSVSPNGLGPLAVILIGFGGVALLAVLVAYFIIMRNKRGISWNQNSIFHILRHGSIKAREYENGLTHLPRYPEGFSSCLVPWPNLVRA